MLESRAADRDCVEAAVRWAACVPAAEGVVTLTVRLTQEGIDDEQLERLTDGLRRELLDLGVERASLGRSGQAPAGTKAGEMTTTGMIVVTLLGSPLLAEVVRLVAVWIGRRGNRSATLSCGDRSMVLTGLSASEQRRLADEFLAGSRG